MGRVVRPSGRAALSPEADTSHTFMNHVIPKMLHGCGVAAAILVAFGGLAASSQAEAARPPGTAGGTGRFPDPPRIAGPVYKPALASDQLIRQAGF